MSEIWKPVVGYEGLYEVSSLGQLKSAPRSGTPGRILRQTVAGAHYLCVSLSRANVKRTLAVHRIVLEAFVGPRPVGAECCHANGNRQDNALTNLRWDTKLANHADRRKHGRIPMGNTHPMRKLCAEDVAAIRRLRGMTNKAIAALYAVGESTIQRIRTRTTWRSVA